MKRNILFRGKAKFTDSWFFGDLATAYSEGFNGDIDIYKVILPHGVRIEHHQANPHFDHCYVKPETIGQFTGLLDMNETRIFEGDIVKWDDCSNGEYWRFAVVEMNPDLRFNCLPIGSVNGVENSTDHVFKYGSFIYTETEKYLTVIGNIYDNPELLNREKKR